MGGPIDIEQRGLEVIHDHDRDHLVTKVRCKDLPDSDWGDFRCRRAIDSSSLIYVSANFVFKDPISERSALVQVMAWHLSGIMPLPEPLLTKMSDAKWHHQVTMC